MGDMNMDLKEMDDWAQEYDLHTTIFYDDIPTFVRLQEFENAEGSICTREISSIIDPILMCDTWQM